MLFNSYIFIFLFLPITLIGYYACNQYKRYELGKAWLTVMSLWFYGYFNFSYLLIMLSSIAVNYGLHAWMYQAGIREDGEKRAEHPARDILWKKRIRVPFLLGMLFNIGILFYFKYYDFFIENMNAAFRSDFALKHILLPLGISFFTFQQISFLVDIYRGEGGKYSFIDYALFVCFFPQLIAGPIVTHKEMIPQFQDETKKKIDWEWFSKGVVIFILGMFKKVIIADTFGKAVDWGYTNVSLLDSTNGILLMLFYAVQLYFDFSGYCDMARGIGYFFHVEIPLNFNSPYKAVDVLDFWKRWHMTLNRFMTQYVYIPLGGNRKGTVRTYVNFFAIFIVSGIWHGAGWTYIVWGLMHGVACTLNRMGRKWIARVPHFITRIVTFVFFCVSIVYFRAESVHQANEIMGRVMRGGFGKLNMNMAELFNLDEFWYILKVLHMDTGTYSKGIICIIMLVITLSVAFWGKNVNELAERFKPCVWNAVALAGLFVWCVVSLSGVSTFLYFNF